MKIKLLAVLVLSSAAMAQVPVAPPQQNEMLPGTVTTTYSDVYCAGFVTRDGLKQAKSVVASLEAPQSTLYSTGDILFLTGTNYHEGEQYSIVREVRDLNRYEVFKGQKAAMSAAGDPFADLGRVRILSVRGNYGVAQVEFSCQPITVGDIALPFVERPMIEYRARLAMENIPQPNGKLSGRIVLAREFDSEIGRGQKVYLNVGSSQGVKAGDYFRVMRTFDADRIEGVDAISYKAPVGEDTQKHRGDLNATITRPLPSKTLGELVVLSVSPTSATAMVTFASDSMHLGDKVELEELPAAQ